MYNYGMSYRGRGIVANDRFACTLTDLVYSDTEPQRHAFAFFSHMGQKYTFAS